MAGLVHQAVLLVATPLVHQVPGAIRYIGGCKIGVDRRAAKPGAWCNGTSAAHKLGSPLNTITVIAHELSRDIKPDGPIYEDITLLRAEIERRRVIL